jgi:hypothetical protein
MKSKSQRTKAEHWCRLNVRGINPYSIDRVEGTVIGRGKLLYAPLVWVKAYELNLPDGTHVRFDRLRDAKAEALRLREGGAA